MPPTPSAARIRGARVLAVSADLLQIAVLPAFSPGIASPFNDVLDFVVAAAMVALLGWHWALLPTLVAELVPFWNLVPNWTAAVFLVTRERGASVGRP